LDDYDEVVRCITRGAEDHLPKPCDPTLLRARIVSSLDKKRLWDELNQNYRNLQQLEEQRDSLVHMIVHDMRAPLTSIMTGLEMFDFMPDMDAETRQELLVLAQRGSHALLGMINDLLDISRMENGMLELEKKPLTPAVIVDGALAQVNPLITEKHFSLVCELDEKPLIFTGDEEKLRRVLVNLLSNAIKFTPQGGTLTVGAWAVEHVVRFLVRDTGEGIPQDAHSKIFEKFGQVETRKSGRKMSTGLGLTYCKMAVEAHGGRIGVDSELGKGSTFWFDLPLAS
jgi:signal transduction histidine kinase